MACYSAADRASKDIGLLVLRHEAVLRRANPKARMEGLGPGSRSQQRQDQQ
jgi:hypothetical protein